MTDIAKRPYRPEASREPQKCRQGSSTGHNRNIRYSARVGRRSAVRVAAQITPFGRGTGGRASNQVAAHIAAR